MLKNITLSAESIEIDQAREKAKREGTTLNDTFRKWLHEYSRPQVDHAAFSDAVQKMRKTTSGNPQRKFTRDEMNERR